MYDFKSIPKMNKKAYSTGFTWIFALVSIFGLGILYITFSQVFTAHIVPTVKGLTDNESYMGQNIPVETSQEIHANIDRFMDFFNTMPYILFGVIIIYMLLAAWRKEQHGQYV